MSELNKKIEILEKKLALQLKSSKNSLKINFIVYLLLAIFVISYTSYVTISFKKLATPPTVAELLIMETEKSLPKINNYLNDNSEVLANSFASETVEYIRSMIPSFGILIKMQFDGIIDSVNEEFSVKYITIIDEYFKLHKTEIIKSINTLSDEKAARLLAEELMKQVNFELIDINNEFTSSVLDLKQQINKLAYTPNNKLTRKELAHKRAVAYWIYLLKHAETGQLKL